MHDAARVRIFQRRQQGAQDFNSTGFIIGEIALTQMAFGQIRQHVIHQALVATTNLVNTHDAGMLKFGDCSGFLFEALFADFVGKCLGRHDFNRNLAIQRFLHTQIHLGHAASANTS